MEEAYWLIPQKLDAWKKTGLIRAPIASSRTSTGSRLASLKRDRALAWRLIRCSSASAAARLPVPCPVGCAREAVSFSLLTCVMLSRFTFYETFNCCDELFSVERWLGELGDDLPTPQH